MYPFKVLTVLTTTVCETLSHTHFCHTHSKTMFVINTFVKTLFETNIAKPFVRPSVTRSRLYLYFMSTQVDEGIKEGVEGVDDALIDSLIDAVHFDDLVLEKDVANVYQIEVFVLIMRSMPIRQSLKILEKHVNYNYLNVFVFVLGKVFLNLDNRSRMMVSGVLLLLPLTIFLRIIL